MEIIQRLYREARKVLNRLFHPFGGLHIEMPMEAPGKLEQIPLSLQP